jgi:hypothetical protein
MRSTIKTFPDDLPYVRIFIDDLEIIAKILTEAVGQAAQERHEREAELRKPTQRAEVPAPSGPPGRPLKTAYVMEDAEVDSVEELLEQGGSVKNLTVKVEADRGFTAASLSIDGRQRPRCYFFGLGEEERWAAYGRIRVVLQKRKVFLKNLIDSLPEWLTDLAGWAAILTPSVLLLVPKSGAWVIVGVAYVLYLFAFTLGFLVWTSESGRIYLVRSHERTKSAKESRKEWTSTIIKLVLGAAILKGAEWLTKLFSK